jgi:hypothetical protein
MNGIVNAPRRMTLALASGAVLIGVLSGCGPELVANERGGIVSGSKASAFSLADAHCHKFGRVAQVTVIESDYNRYAFACVEP